MPVFSGLDVVGVVARHPGFGGVAVFVDPDGRGRGAGRAVVSQLVDRRVPVVTADAGEGGDFWSGRGFDGVRVADDVWRFTPPPAAGTHPVLA
jgi:hypothetical protein